MASELRVNTLKDASGNNSIATSYVATGSAKSWCNLNGTGTIAIRGSQNVASLTDDGTGDYKTNFTSNMSDANFSGVIISGTVTEGGTGSTRDQEVRGTSSSHLGVHVFHTSSEAARDVDYVATAVHGALA